MPILLMSGGDAALAQAEMPPSLLVRVNWRFPEGSPAIAVDASAFLLNRDGVVRSDRDWICYYQPNDINGAVVRQPPSPPDQDSFQVVLSSIAGSVQRLVFGLTLEATAATPVFNAVADIHIVLSDPMTGATLIDHHSRSELGTENGLLVAELYRDGHGWAFHSIDQSFAGRLAALATHFGVRMTDEEWPDPPTVRQDKAPVQPVSGQIDDCTCRTTLMMSKAGTTGCEFLMSLWQEKMALNRNSVMINLLDEDPLHMVRMLLRCEQGCPLTVPEIQNTIKRALLQ